MNLTLMLYPTEFRALIVFLHDGAMLVPESPTVATVGSLVLREYYRRWKPNHALVWQQRRRDREYRLRLPLSVARALYDDLQRFVLYGQQQNLLNKLDQALINYQEPQMALLLTTQTNG